MKIDPSTCTFQSNFTVLVDSIKPGLATQTTFSTDSNGTNILISAIADSIEGATDANSIGSTVQDAENPIFITALNNSATVSAVFSNSEGQRFVYYGQPDGVVAIVEVGSDGRPENTSSVVLHISNNARITGLELSESGELIVSQTDGYTIFRVDPLSGDLTMLSDFRSGLNTYGTATVYQYPKCCWNGAQDINLTGPTTVEIGCADAAPQPNFTANAGDGCNLVFSTVIHYPPSCGNQPNIVFNITATSCCGYSQNLIQTVNRVDVSPPVVNLIGNATVTAACNESIVAQGMSFLEISDDCSDTQNITVNEVTVTKLATCDPVTKIYATGDISLTITDTCGNPTIFNETVSIVDNVAPFVPSFPPNVLLPICATNLDLEQAPYNVCAFNITDGCVGVNCTVIDDNSKDTCSTFTRTYVVTDDCGNSRTFVRVFTRPEDVTPFVNVPNNTVIEDTNFCHPDQFNVSFPFFQTTGSCVNPNITQNDPVVLTDGHAICYGIQVVCQTVTTNCVSLCNCIPVRISSLPVTISIVGATNYNQKPGETGHNFSVNNFTLPTVTAPCGGPFDANSFLAAGGNISVYSLFVTDPVLVPNGLNNEYQREIRVSYIFDDGCDYDVIPCAASFIQVEGMMGFINNITIPSIAEFQQYLYTGLGVTYTSPPNFQARLGEKQEGFLIRTGEFFHW